MDGMVVYKIGPANKRIHNVVGKTLLREYNARIKENF